jgi:conjugative relaxase-like TrwC/TraI family protein
MFSIRAQLTLGHAKSYFKEHLQVGDYHSEDKKVVGQWIGKGATLLNLEGNVREESFFNLVNGLHPETGDKLVQRLNSVRHTETGQESNRRYFYDVCLSPPKSVSIAGLLEDPRVFQIHNRCVEQAIGLLETYAATRVRKGGQNTDRFTRNIVGAIFHHDTSRLLDPHMHTHCILLNVTYDPEEQKWKALQNVSMLKAQKLVHMQYMDVFAKELQILGYKIVRNEKGFEIENIPKELIKKFSKRHEQIESLYQTEKKKEENKHLTTEELKARIAYDHRNRKIKDLSLTDLKERWIAELTAEEKAMLEKIVPQSKPLTPSYYPITSEEAFERAESIIFERKTLSTKEEILAKVLEVSLGSEHAFETIQDFYENRPYLKDPISGRLTLKLTLEREQAIIHAVEEGKGKYEAFLNVPHLKNESLNTAQSLCVQGILGSQDFAVFLKGSAGTGKSFTLKTLTECLVEGGRTVQVFAPQRQQVLDLSKDGLESQTVPHLLTRGSGSIQQNSVWIVDEAGQISGKQMQRLLELAKEHSCRVIFSEDTKQHGAVKTSDALIAIEKYAKIKTFDLNEVRRQDPLKGRTKQEQFAILSYKKAVCYAASGNVLRAIKGLDALGWIQELSKDQAVEAIAKGYTGKMHKDHTCLVISQTKEEVHNLNMAIRRELKDQEQIGKEQVVKAFSLKDKVLGERQDSAHYETGDYLLFHKTYGDIGKSNLLEVVGKDDTHVFLKQNDQTVKMSLKYSSYFNIYKAREQELAEGERLQLKLNGTSQEGLKIGDGELVTFLGLADEESLRVRDEQGIEKTLKKDQAIFNLGYAVTSYEAQGKTVDSVFIYDSQNKLAINKKEFYVSISKGRKEAKIYTTDKAALKEHVQQQGKRGLDLGPGLELEKDLALKTIDLDQQLDYNKKKDEEKVRKTEYAVDL